MKFSNIKMEMMLEALKPILPHRDKIGYIAARNTRILNDTLTEYFTFKRELISKYGNPDKDENGNDIFLSAIYSISCADQRPSDTSGNTLPVSAKGFS